MKLRYLLLAIFSLVTAVPLVLFWLWPHSQSMTSELEDVRDRHLLIAETLGIALQNYHQDVVATFELIHTNLIDHKKVEGAEDLLQNLHFRNICVFATDSGRLALRMDSFDNRCPESLSESELAEFSDLAAQFAGSMSPVVAERIRRILSTGTPE